MYERDQYFLKKLASLYSMNDENSTVCVIIFVWNWVKTLVVVAVAAAAAVMSFYMVTHIWLKLDSLDLVHMMILTWFGKWWWLCCTQSGIWGQRGVETQRKDVKNLLHNRRLPIDWLIGWLVDWLIDWLVGSFVRSFVRSFIHSLVGWLVGWLIGWLVGWLVRSFVRSFIPWLVGWLVRSFVRSFLGWLVDWLIDWWRWSTPLLLWLWFRKVRV